MNARKCVAAGIVALLFGAVAWGQAIPLSQIVGPNNALRDPVYGISLTYPAGWEVMTAMRWGKNNKENTVMFKQLEPLTTRPSLYYQPTSNFDAPKTPEEVEGHFRATSVTKAQQRVSGGLGDYRNDENSLEFSTVNGCPTFRYKATFTRGGVPFYEYFVRVLGKDLMAMFFVQGPADEYQIVRGEIDKMVATIKVP